MNGLSIVFVQEVKDILNTRNFLDNDFDIKIKEYDEVILITISYLYIPNYVFEGEVSKRKESFSADYCPGTVVSNVQKEALHKYEFFNSIREWLSSMDQEMARTPLAREMLKQDETLRKFQESIHNMDELTKEFFTKEEGKELEEKLDRLEEMLANSYESVNMDNVDKEIKKMHSEIVALKKQIELLDKKNWFLSLSARIFNWYKKNPSVARQVAGFTREMLPQEAKDVVTQEALDQLLLPTSDPDNR